MKNYDYRDDDYYKKKKLIKWTMLALVLFIAVIIAGVRLTSVTVKGNSRYTAEEIEARIFPGYWDKNSLYCFIKDKTTPHKELPFIEDYDIQFKSPFSADLVVYEKDVIGYVKYMSSNMYFDKDGIIVESSERKIEDVPEITGLSFGHIVLNKELPVTDKELFNEIMNLTQQLQFYNIKSYKIAFDNMKNITIYIDNGTAAEAEDENVTEEPEESEAEEQAAGEESSELSGAEEEKEGAVNKAQEKKDFEGGIKVKMGASDNIDSKISLLNDMLPKLSGLSGTLHLENYSDGSSGIYTFEKAK